VRPSHLVSAQPPSIAHTSAAEESLPFSSGQMNSRRGMSGSLNRLWGRRRASRPATHRQPACRSRRHLPPPGESARDSSPLLLVFKRYEQGHRISRMRNPLSPSRLPQKSFHGASKYAAALRASRFEPNGRVTPWRNHSLNSPRLSLYGASRSWVCLSSFKSRGKRHMRGVRAGSSPGWPTAATLAANHASIRHQRS